MDIGTQLRNAREARGLTLDALSRSTRVQPRILSAIEQNDSMRLPPRPYGRGFVRAYASEVGLDSGGHRPRFLFPVRPRRRRPGGVEELDRRRSPARRYGAALAVSGNRRSRRTPSSAAS